MSGLCLLFDAQLRAHRRGAWAETPAMKRTHETGGRTADEVGECPRTLQ